MTRQLRANFDRLPVAVTVGVVVFLPPLPDAPVLAAVLLRAAGTAGGLFFRLPLWHGHAGAREPGSLLALQGLDGKSAAKTSHATIPCKDEATQDWQSNYWSFGEWRKPRDGGTDAGRRVQTGGAAGASRRWAYRPSAPRPARPEEERGRFEGGACSPMGFLSLLRKGKEPKSKSRPRGLAEFQ